MMEPENLRTCSKCGKTLGRGSFGRTYSKRGNPDGRRLECRTCTNTRLRSYYDESASTKKFAYKLKERYGMTVEEYLSLLESQGGGCAICGTTQNHGRRLAVDHCHETGVNRGILCDECNFAVGKVKNDPAIALSLVKYLQAASDFLVVPDETP